MIFVQYDRPIEVTKEKYELIMRGFPMTCAGKIEGGKYFVKLWMPKYRFFISKIINS